MTSDGSAPDDYDEFLALASHELKTPTATLLASAQLLRRQLDQQGALEPDQLRRAVDRLHEQTERLGLLVENVLDAARINSGGGLTLEIELTDVAGLVERVVSSFRLAHPRHSITVVRPDHLEAIVDEARFERIVANLLSNAVRYSPAGGSIEIELLLTDQGKLCMSVRDHGTGIPADGHARLFERFYRGHAESEISGIGIGLFVTRHLVELHGGAITADSPAGGGARLTVLIPTAKV